VLSVELPASLGSFNHGKKSVNQYLLQQVADSLLNRGKDLKGYESKRLKTSKRIKYYLYTKKGIEQ
jgi:hypothetical protein